MEKQKIKSDENNIAIIPTWTDVRVLAADTAESHTIPSYATKVRLTGTNPFFANLGAAAAIPAADDVTGTASALILTERIYKIMPGVTTIGLIPAGSNNCIVTLEFES